MSASDSIIFGIVSGILASAILFLMTEFFRNIAIPWYRRIIYNGIDISGKWFSKKTNPSGNVEDSTMIIKQQADMITCTINIAKKSSGDSHAEIKTYEISGTLRDRFLEISGRNSDSQSIGVHSELLEVFGDGKTMQGYNMWYSVTNKTIQSSDVIWKRQQG